MTLLLNKELKKKRERRGLALISMQYCLLVILNVIFNTCINDPENPW